LELDHLLDGLSTAGLVLVAALLAVLAWRGKDRTTVWALISSVVCAFLLALSFTLAATGMPNSQYRIMAVLATLVSTFFLLRMLPGWIQACQSSENLALVEEMEQALGRLRVTESHLGILVEKVRGHPSTRFRPLRLA
jgi:hypothetical protein